MVIFQQVTRLFTLLQISCILTRLLRQFEVQTDNPDVWNACAIFGFLHANRHQRVLLNYYKIPSSGMDHHELATMKIAAQYAGDLVYSYLITRNSRQKKVKSVQTSKSSEMPLGVGYICKRKVKERYLEIAGLDKPD